MNRLLLTCLVWALPSFAIAATCDILPYANQCQGSNLWPVPSGWSADTDGDCQPQKDPIAATAYFAMYTDAPAFYPLLASAAKLPTPQAAADHYCSVVTGNYPGCYLMPGLGAWGGVSHTGKALTRYLGCAQGGLIYCPTCTYTTEGYACSAPSTKQSDGRCTARWVSAAKTALQKDPLDPDCDANSCLTDGTCQLK